MIQLVNEKKQSLVSCTVGVFPHGLQLRNKSTSTVGKAKSESILDLISSFYSTPANFWKAVKSNKNNTFLVPTMVTFDVCLQSDHKEIILVLNQHLIASGHLFEDWGLDHSPIVDRLLNFSQPSVYSRSGPFKCGKRCSPWHQSQEVYWRGKLGSLFLHSTVQYVSISVQITNIFNLSIPSGISQIFENGSCNSPR